MGAPITSEAHFTPEPYECGIASRKESSIGSDSGLLQGYPTSACFSQKTFQQNRHLARTLELHVPVTAAASTLAPKNFKSNSANLFFTR